MDGGAILGLRPAERVTWGLWVEALGSGLDEAWERDRRSATRLGRWLPGERSIHMVL